MHKPPHESLLFQATTRMLRWLLVILFAVLIPTVGASLAREFFPGLAARAPAVRPLLPVPGLGETTDGSSARVVRALGSKIPPEPGPNQKRAGTCNPKAAQVEINGGCWVQTQTPPPCPEGVQWEHEGHCWLPVAPAARSPTSGGGSLPVTIAE